MLFIFFQKAKNFQNHDFQKLHKNFLQNKKFSFFFFQKNKKQKFLENFSQKISKNLSSILKFLQNKKLFITYLHHYQIKNSNNKKYSTHYIIDIYIHFFLLHFNLKITQNNFHLITFFIKKLSFI